jgi:membrane-bound lytic murein transglycosylase C
VLNNEEFVAVTNQNSRDYCVIAAYNTGPHNVTKVFASDRTAAFNAINAEPPATLFDRLRTGLPMQETRDYVVKVTGHRKEFLSAPAAAAPATATAPATAKPTARIGFTALGGASA